MDGRNIGQAEIYVDLCKGGGEALLATDTSISVMLCIVHKGDGLVFKKEKKKLRCGKLSKIVKPSYKLLPQ